MIATMEDLCDDHVCGHPECGPTAMTRLGDLLAGIEERTK